MNGWIAHERWEKVEDKSIMYHFLFSLVPSSGYRLLALRLLAFRKPARNKEEALD